MIRKSLRNVLVVMPLMVAGCLQKETTHTLYLSPDGAVAWTVFEKDVRSDESDAARRRAEEGEYLAAASAGSHGIGRGLAALAPLSVHTRVLRARRPFTVVTEGEFSRLDEALERMLGELRVPGYAHLTHDGVRTTLVIHVDVPSGDDTGENGEPGAVTGLLEDLDHYRIVLTDGRFVAATGFTLVDDGAAAVLAMIPGNEVTDQTGPFDLTLSWEVRR